MISRSCWIVWKSDREFKGWNRIYTSYHEPGANIPHPELQESSYWLDWRQLNLDNLSTCCSDTGQSAAAISSCSGTRGSLVSSGKSWTGGISVVVWGITQYQNNSCTILLYTWPRFICLVPFWEIIPILLLNLMDERRNYGNLNVVDGISLNQKP